MKRAFVFFTMILVLLCIGGPLISAEEGYGTPLNWMEERDYEVEPQVKFDEPNNYYVINYYFDKIPHITIQTDDGLYSFPPKENETADHLFVDYLALCVYFTGFDELTFSTKYGQVSSLSYPDTISFIYQAITTHFLLKE